MSHSLMTLGRDLGEGLLHLLLPTSCHLCGIALRPPFVQLCESCRSQLLTDPVPSCPHCAATVGPYGAPTGLCTRCRNAAFAFEQVVRLGPYEGRLQEAVLRLKHRTNEGFAELIGEAWAAAAQPRFDALDLDAIVPVPLHWLRRWQRGYNQSGSLAFGMATRLRLPLQMWWLKRVRNTPSQKALSATARHENVRGAFRVRATANMRGCSVLLVDDVMTTGATAHEAARALRAGGAKRVVVAALSRAQS